MKKYLLIGLITLSINVMATETVTREENNSSKTEQSNSKVLIIDLDKEAEENEQRGAIDDIIKGIIPLGHNDEVTFFGENVLLATPITITIVDKYNKIKKTLIDVFTIKTADLNVGDSIKIRNKRDVLLVEKKVTK